MQNQFTLQQHETAGANLQKTRVFLQRLELFTQAIYGMGSPAELKTQTALIAVETLMDELRGLYVIEHKGAPDAYGSIFETDEYLNRP